VSAMNSTSDPYRVGGLFVAFLATVAIWAAILAPLVWSHRL
jgi:hypothetical protein